EPVIVLKLRPIGKQLEEAMVLLQLLVVDDLPLLTERMSAGVDQRLVFQMFVLMPGNGIDGEEGTLDRPAAFGDDLLVMQQVLAGSRQGIVVNRVGPECLVVDVPLAEKRQHGLEKSAVLHAEGDLLEVEGLNVFAAERAAYILIGAVLRDVV